MKERALRRDGQQAAIEWIAARAARQATTENFPVALRVLPRRAREHLGRVYAYARLVDDVGDSAPGDRLALLEIIENDVRALFAAATTQSAGPQLSIVRDLRTVIDECHLPAAPLLDLIEANRVDQLVSSYETFDDLLDYCRLSAAPIGRMVLHVADAATESNIADSDAVCAALQVLEHCQDVGEDAAAGRVYLPAVDLRAAGIQSAELHADSTSAALRRVISAQVDRAAAMLEPGRPLVRRLSGWPRVAVAGYVAGGLATVDALRRADHDVHARHLRPSKPATGWYAIRLIVGRRS
jgi:squalene synthase HpnC